MIGEVPMLAGHPALDLLNTVVMVDGELRDFLEHDADVLGWLRLAGLPVEEPKSAVRSGSLVRAARSLRETFRLLVEKQKTGKPGDMSGLNAFLIGAQSYPRLVLHKSRQPTIERVRRQGTPEQILGPVAEAAADLLAHGDFDLVKHCEDASCVLWFYDQTKSHHRRWCSTAACGNRNKVAAYRKRQQG